MNFKQELINRVTKDINLLVAHGKSRTEAIEQVKKESSAGAAVWIEIEK